jgi:hypothetical protein
MIAIKAKVARSWLTAAGKAVAAQFCARLLERCQDETEGRFITLTYRRVEGETPADLYRRTSEERHVRLFVRKLQTKLKRNLTGQWLCKMEFQRGGWVHWHLLVLGLGFIENRDVEKWWGHGCVDVKRMTPANIKYVSKYVAKDGDFPHFLHLERTRSVRVVRVSPGFWKNVEPPEESYVGERRPTWIEERVNEETGEVEQLPERPLPWYRPIGQMIEQSETGVVMRDAQSGVYGQVKADPCMVLEALAKKGARPVGGCDGWLLLDNITMDDVHGVVESLRVAAEGVSGLPAAPAAKRPLDLIRSPDPHNSGWKTPLWLEWFLTWDYGWLDEPDVSSGSVEISAEEQ